MSAALQLFYLSHLWNVVERFPLMLSLIRAPSREIRAEINSSECLFLAQPGPLDVFNVFIKNSERISLYEGFTSWCPLVVSVLIHLNTHFGCADMFFFFFFLNLCPSDVYSNSFLQGCHPKTEEGTFRERTHGVLITGVSVGLVSHFPKRENMFFLSICEKIPSCWSHLL